MQNMQSTLILDSLNPAQQAAVTAPAEHHLILAGAGSGKTRVLVHRIAWLVIEQRISPERILAVTFTNKAAQQMHERIEGLLHVPVSHLWIGTFHGMAHRLLRRHWQAAELPNTFQVIDSDDQQRLIRRVMKNQKLDDDRWPPKQAQWFINTQKEEGIRSQQVDHTASPLSRAYAPIYQEYEQICRSSGLVDFSELLLRSYELLQQNPELLTHYQERFQHILVDEFQDTNQIQYRWLQLLAGTQSKLMMVGDDDQSIYSWRGAKAEHLQRFIKDYPRVQTVRLEENYRSTGRILAAANGVISHNQQRLGKNLWTQAQPGEKINLYAAIRDRDEAQFVINQVYRWIEGGGSQRDAAVLYRSNAQSRVLEEALLQAGMSYRIYGGLRFFERAEIKDALAYLRLIVNPADDGAFERVVNLPARGIGETTLATIQDCARQQRTSFWHAGEILLQAGTLAARSATAIRGFMQLIQDLRTASSHMALPEQVSYVLEKSGLLYYYRQDASEKGRGRVENLEELINGIYQFTPQQDPESATPLTAYLAHVTLNSGEEAGDPMADSIHLMTLHSAKGLEFPLVFLTGMEEGLFPHAMSARDPRQLEEERRLCYVGMTRAMGKLYMTYAQSRYLNGKEMYQRPSRFLKEIPRECIAYA